MFQTKANINHEAGELAEPTICSTREWHVFLCYITLHIEASDKPGREYYHDKTVTTMISQY